MKKVLLSVAVVAAFGMTSCGGGDYCGCLEEVAEMEKEAGSDADKLKAASEKGKECAEMLPEDKEEAAEIVKGCK